VNTRLRRGGSQERLELYPYEGLRSTLVLFDFELSNLTRYRGMSKIFHWGPRLKAAIRMGFLGGCSNPSPPAMGSEGSVGTGSSVTGHRINDFGQVGSGRVTVSVTDPVSDPVFVAFARASLLLLGRECATFESLGFRVLCIFMSCFLLAQVLVICYFLVVSYARKFYLLSCGRSISAKLSEKEVDLIV